MAAYHSESADPNRPVAGMKLPEALTTLIGGDAYISLNMYNAENGPSYSEEFIGRYRSAQRARNQRITDWVVTEIDRLKIEGVFERVFTMQRVWADLRLMGPAIDRSDREIGICYAGDARRANFDARGIGNMSSLRSWLSMWSLEYSCCSGSRHLQRIELPALVIQSTADAGVFPSDAEKIFDDLASDDKELKLVAGDHYLLEPEGIRGIVADLIGNWVRARI